MNNTKPEVIEKWRNECEQLLVNGNILADLRRKPSGEYVNVHVENHWQGFLSARNYQSARVGHE